MSKQINVVINFVKLIFLQDIKIEYYMYIITMEKKSLIFSLWNNIHPVAHFWLLISAFGMLCMWGALSIAG